MTFNRFSNPFSFSFIVILGFFTQTATSQIEPSAGTWRTWVLTSGKDYRLPAPPNQKASLQELQELLSLQKKRDEKAIKMIYYWDAGAPGYRWNQLASSLSNTQTPAFRTLGLLHVAIYDATVAAWNTKYAFNRQRPSQISAQLKPWIPDPESPSYPCAHAVAAGAAATLLSYLFPQKADSIQNLAHQACQSRLFAGVQYPSDVRAGFQLGKRVAEQVILYAQKDGSEVVQQGVVPNQAGLWKGSNPVGLTWGTWKPWVLDSANQFRPVPPPDFTKDMEELKNFKQTPKSRANFYYYATQDVWSDLTSQKIFEYNLHTNPPRAARVYALKSIALYDATLACWEAKYKYWGIRPYQYDTTYKQALGTPPFPGYPSGHAALSGSLSKVLGYLFPDEKEYFQQKAEACAESRFEGGLHFRSDNVVGLELGAKVGEQVVRFAKSDGANVPLRSGRK